MWDQPYECKFPDAISSSLFNTWEEGANFVEIVKSCKEDHLLVE